MTANVAPIYGLTPQTTFTAGGITAANTATDGTGTVYTVYTAGANGGKIDRIRVKGLGSNNASVMRVFINNGSTQGTATNNVLWGELVLPAFTAANNAALGPDLDYSMNLTLKAAYVVNVCFGTAGTAGWVAAGEAIDF